MDTKATSVLLKATFGNSSVTWDVLQRELGDCFRELH